MMNLTDDFSSQWRYQHFIGNFNLLAGKLLANKFFEDFLA